MATFAFLSISAHRFTFSTLRGPVRSNYARAEKYSQSALVRRLCCWLRILRFLYNVSYHKLVRYLVLYFCNIIQNFKTNHQKLVLKACGPLSTCSVCPLVSAVLLLRAHCISNAQIRGVSTVRIFLKLAILILPILSPRNLKINFFPGLYT